MKFFLKSSIFLMLLLSFHKLHAQDSLEPIKFRRNALKFGTSLTLSKYFLSYEYALSKHVSIGGMMSYSLGNFPGYSATIFIRYYVRKFNKSGWFFEARGSYAHFTPTAYTGYTSKKRFLLSDSNVVYQGKHKADIDYWSGGLSAGYKIFCNERVFFEFMGGLHYGKATFGRDDIYLARSRTEVFFGTDLLKEVFKNSGPGMPAHFMCTFGYGF